MPLLTYDSPVGVLPYELDRKRGQVILTVPDKLMSKVTKAAQGTSSIRKAWTGKQTVGLTLKSTRGEGASVGVLAGIALGELTMQLSLRKRNCHAARTRIDRQRKRNKGYCFRGSSVRRSGARKQ